MPTTPAHPRELALGLPAAATIRRAVARPAQVAAMLERFWRRRAPKRLLQLRVDS